MADDVPPDVTPPDLEQPPTTAPPIEGDAEDPHGRLGHEFNPPQGTSGPPPSHPGYLVSVSSISDACNAILAAVGQATSAYEALKAEVDSTKAWILWAPGPDTMVQDHPSTKGIGLPTPPRPATDPNPEATADFGAIEDNLEAAGAGWIEAALDYVNMLEGAGEIYTQADKASVMPPLRQ